MSRLYIETDRKNSRTVVKDRFFTAPFKITSPFYNGETAEIIIMQASAGILEGDRLDIELVIRSGSKVLITGQSYTKLFKMEHGRAEQRVKITVERGACLYYLPRPIIPFKESEFLNINEINVEEGAQLVIQDIFACGRSAMGEDFAFRRYNSHTKVYENGTCIFADNTRLVPKEFDISGVGYFEGYTHQGMAYLYGFIDAPRLDNCTLTAAVSNAQKGYLVRLLGTSGDEIERQIKNIIFGGNSYGI